MSRSYLVGMDVGSTTVKAVVTDAATDEVVWRDYQRHDTRQPEKVLEFLRRFEEEVPEFAVRSTRVFITGSGGSSENMLQAIRSAAWSIGIPQEGADGDYIGFTGMQMSTTVLSSGWPSQFLGYSSRLSRFAGENAEPF